jgi:hypothetical protein
VPCYGCSRIRHSKLKRDCLINQQKNQTTIPLNQKNISFSIGYISIGRISSRCLISPFQNNKGVINYYNKNRQTYLNMLIIIKNILRRLCTLLQNLHQ